MEYTLDQIREENNNYDELCNRFFKLAKTEEDLENLKQILNEGKYNDFSFSTGLCSKNNTDIEVKRRISMADLYLKRRETLEVISQKKVNLFHGTNFNALPNILKYGLNSAKTLEEINVPVETGEEWSRRLDARSFISFTDSLDVSEYYSATEDNSSFEIIIGTNAYEISNLKSTSKISSDVPEIGIEETLPVSSIKVIMVPKEKINFVKKLIVNEEISVVAINDFNNKFYYYDVLESYDNINISEEDYLNYLNGNYNEEKEKIFEIEEIKKVSSNRLLSNIKIQIDKIKSIVMKDGDLDYDGRTI